jgi:hypothetical protein
MVALVPTGYQGQMSHVGYLRLRLSSSFFRFPQKASTTTLRLSYGPVTVSGTDSCRFNLREFFFSFPSSKGARFIPAGHHTALVRTRYRLTSPPVILRANFFLYVIRTMLVIIPAGYRSYWYLSATDCSRYVLKSGNFCFIPWSARVITRRLPLVAGPCTLPASPGILGLGYFISFSQKASVITLRLPVVRVPVGYLLLRV